MGCRACLSDRQLLNAEIDQLNNFLVNIDAFPLNFHCKDRLKVIVNRANIDRVISPDDEEFLGRFISSAMTGTWGFMPECSLTPASNDASGSISWWVLLLAAGVVVYVATR